MGDQRFNATSARAAVRWAVDRMWPAGKQFKWLVACGECHCLEEMCQACMAARITEMAEIKQQYIALADYIIATSGNEYFHHVPDLTQEDLFGSSDEEEEQVCPEPETESMEGPPCKIARTK